MNSSPANQPPAAAREASMWDERCASSGLVWSAEPNALAASLLRNLAPGRALDVAAGEGRMALWLSGMGWRVTALHFSAGAWLRADPVRRSSASRWTGGSRTQPLKTWASPRTTW